MTLPMALMVAIAEPVRTPKAMDASVQMMPSAPRTLPISPLSQSMRVLDMPLCSMMVPAYM